MINKLIVWFYGYIHIEVSGCNISRFLNICSARGIEFYSVENMKDKAIIKMQARDFFALHDVVRKCRIKVKINKKTGFPFFVHKNRKRKMMFLGILTSFIMMFVLSLFVWQISVEGNYTYSDEEILDFLEENGVSHGIYKNNINGEELERAIRNEYFDITWVSVELTGTRLIIHIKENFNIENINDNKNDFKDIVAKEDGIIDSIVTRSGTPMVKAGDLVKAGDVLIKGNYDIVDDSGTVIDTKDVVADGTIYELVVYEYYDKISIGYKNKKYLDEDTSYKFVIFDKMIDIDFFGNKNNTSDYVYNVKQLKLTDNFYLPVYMYTCTEKEYEIYDDEYDKSECISILNENFNYFLENLDEKSIQIIENNVKIENTDGYFVAKGDIVVLKEVD